jgi:hypothetical protein
MRIQEELKVGTEDLGWDQEQLGSERNIQCKEQKLSDWEHEILEIGRVISGKVRSCLRTCGMRNSKFKTKNKICGIENKNYWKIGRAISRKGRYCLRTGRCGIRKGSFNIRNKSCKVENKKIEIERARSRTEKCGLRKENSRLGTKD